MKYLPKASVDVLASVFQHLKQHRNACPVIPSYIPPKVVLAAEQLLLIVNELSWDVTCDSKNSLYVAIGLIWIEYRNDEVTVECSCLHTLYSTLEANTHG